MGSEESGLADIVVTAQRRSESSQRAAIALTAVTAEDLTRASVTDPAQLATIVPSLKITPTGGSNVNIYIRGVGTQAANAFAENAIAVNLDGVYLGRPAGLSGMLYDLERVEVLKGPQGLLYGRNATGGAVNLITRQARLGEVEGQFAFEYGNYDSKKLNAAVNLPLGKIAAIRIAGQYVDRDGYLSDSYDDENSKAIRANLLIEPSDDFRMTISADYAKGGGKGVGSVIRPDGAADTVTPPIDDRIGGSDPRSIAVLARKFPIPFANGVILPPRGDGYVDLEAYGVSATVVGDTGFGTITFIPSYRVTTPNNLGYRPGFFALNEEKAKQTSGELRYASPEGNRLRGQAGVYYFYQTQDFRNWLIQGNTIGTEFFGKLNLESFAVFGQATFDVTPEFRLVGGARYTTETKSRNGKVGTRAATTTVVNYATFVEDQSFENVSWKAGFEYDIASRSLLYGHVATGFKSGGFFTGAGNATFAPEKLTAYTLGSKNRLFDNRVQLNLEAFYWDYKDQQVGYIGPVLVGNVYLAGGLTRNVGQARMYGLDAEARVLVGNGGTFSANVQYLDAKYESFKFPAFSGNGAPLLTSCSSSLNPSYPTNAPARVFDLDCSGKAAINSPKWSATLSYEHVIDLGGDLELVPFVSTKIESGRYLAIEYLPTEYQRGFMKSNAALSLRNPKAGWSITGFINNIEDETTINTVVLRPVTPVTYAGLEAPRTYGIRVGYNF